MRLFIDTNVWISAFASQGICAELLRLLQKLASDTTAQTNHLVEKLEVCLSRRVLGELERHLPRFKATAARVGDVLTKLPEQFTVLDAATQLPASVAKFIDPDDRWILADAVAGRCDYFVTGDREVLGLYAVETCRVVTPREVMLWLRTGQPIPRFEAHEERAAYVVRRIREARLLEPS